VTKANRKTWVGHVAYMVEKFTQNFDEKLEGKDTIWKTQAWIR
jgi:hypothetical protein